MSIRLSDVLIFAAGAVIGSVVTWKLIERKYELVEHKEDEINDQDEEFDHRTYDNITAEYTVEGEDEVKIDEAYIISPEEFGDNDYETISLDYFADGIIADDFANVIDVEEIGINPADHFGEYEDDSVHIRNDSRKCDYEILRDERTYFEAYPEEE